MSDDTTDDALLLRRAHDGNEAAFLALYERHRTRIYRFAYRLLNGSASLAEDVTHDCFVSLLRHPERFDPARASLRTYLYAAARHQAWKHFRRAGYNDLALDELTLEPRAAEAQQPLRQLLRSELTEAVRAAIATLPPLQREALVLFEYEALSLAEIALVAGADVGTIKARLSRARSNLRRALAPYSETGAGEKRR